MLLMGCCDHADGGQLVLLYAAALLMIWPLILVSRHVDVSLSCLLHHLTVSK